MLYPSMYSEWRLVMAGFGLDCIHIQQFARTVSITIHDNLWLDFADMFIVCNKSLFPLLFYHTLRVWALCIPHVDNYGPYGHRHA